MNPSDSKVGFENDRSLRVILASMQTRFLCSRCFERLVPIDIKLVAVDKRRVCC